MSSCGRKPAIAGVGEEVLAATRSAGGGAGIARRPVSEEPYPFAHPDPIWRTLQQSNWASRFAAATPGDSEHKLSPTLVAGIDAGLSYRGLDLQRALIKRTELFRGIQQVFAERADFILTPCASAPPVHAEHELTAPLVVDGVEVGDLRSEWTPYLSLFDLSGHPAIAMPAAQAESWVRLWASSWSPDGATTPNCSPPPLPTKSAIGGVRAYPPA